MLPCLEVQPVLIKRIASKKRDDPLLATRIRSLKGGKKIDDLQYLDPNEWLRKKGRFFVPDVGDLSKEVLRDAIDRFLLFIMDELKCIRM